MSAEQLHVLFDVLCSASTFKNWKILFFPDLEQLGNLLRMRQISIETWRFRRRNITRCSWLLYIFECLFNLYNFFAWDKDKVKCTLRFQCIEYLVWTAIEYYNLDTNKKTFDTLNLQSCLRYKSQSSRAWQPVKRKTSTNLGSNRKFNANTTNIYSIQIRVV
jgi:hypothetical protein